MTPLPEMLQWVASHSNRLRRPGYEPPNHLAGGVVKFYGEIGEIFNLDLDENGSAPDYIHEPAPSRIEIFSRDGELLYSENA